MALELQRPGGGSSHAKKPLVKALAINGPRLQGAFLEWPLMAQCCRQSPTEQLTASHLRRGIGSARVVTAWNVDRLGRSLKTCGVLSEFHALRRKR